MLLQIQQMQKPAADAVADKMEDIADEMPKEDKDKDKAMDDATADTDYPMPAATADETINNLGMSEFHALGDAQIKQLKAIRPIVAMMISIKKSERTADQQMVIDSYNEAVRSLNKARTSSGYKTLVKAKAAPATEDGSLVPVVVDSTSTLDVMKFYEGVPFLVGKQKHDEYLAQKGSK